MTLQIIKNFSIRQNNGRLKYFQVKRCYCGKIFTTRKDGKTKSCGCLNQELNKTRRTGYSAYNRIKSAELVKLAAAKAVYRAAKYDDSNISFEDFLNLSQKNCDYCNAPPSNTYHIGFKKDGTLKKRSRRNKNGEVYSAIGHGSYYGEEAAFVYNGLDRVDSSKLHSKDNIVPCCKNCNYMKTNNTLRDFLTHIERIYKWKIKQQN